MKILEIFSPALLDPEQAPTMINILFLLKYQYEVKHKGHQNMANDHDHILPIINIRNGRRQEMRICMFTSGLVGLNLKLQKQGLNLYI